MIKIIMEWKHLPREMKKEILSWVVDTKTLITIKKTIFQSHLLYVCKEFRELITSWLSWGGGNPFTEVNLRDSDFVIHSGRGDYLFVTSSIAEETYYSISREGIEEKLPAKVFAVKGLLFMFRNGNIEVFSSYPFKEPVVIINCLNYLEPLDFYSLTNVKETPIGILAIFTSPQDYLGARSMVLDLEKKSFKILFCSQDEQIIFPWGIGIRRNDSEFDLYFWNSLTTKQTIDRDTYVFVDVHRIGDTYYETAIGYAIISVYSNAEKLLWRAYMESGSYMGFISSEIQGLLMIYRDNKSIIVDILTSSILYQKEGFFCALTLSSEGKYILWKHEDFLMTLQQAE